MGEERGRVIGFPSWRREAAGAPGVPTGPEDHPDARDDVSAEDDAAGAQARTGPRPWASAPIPPSGGGWRPRSARLEAAERSERARVDGRDVEVWHEGATVTGEVLVRLRVDLLGATTPIWRRLECHGSLTLDRLHRVFAAAFGWPHDDARPHRFAEVHRVGASHRLGGTFANVWNERRHVPGESEVRLDEVVVDPRDRLRYWYGTSRRSSFRLTAVAEDVVPLPVASGPIPPARLVTGRRAAPDVAFGTVGLYELARSGAFDRPGLADLPGLLGTDLPPIPDPAAFDPALCDARVRAAAER